jgi:hypothetical protein
VVGSEQTKPKSEKLAGLLHELVWESPEPLQQKINGTPQRRQQRRNDSKKSGEGGSAATAMTKSMLRKPAPRRTAAVSQNRTFSATGACAQARKSLRFMSLQTPHVGLEMRERALNERC